MSISSVTEIQTPEALPGPASVSIAEFAPKEELIFMHGLGVEGYVGPNSPLMAEAADFATKLEILLAFAPHVAASTIKEGEPSRRLWSNVGVILSGGDITSARPYDAGSIATSIHSRELSAHATKEKAPIAEQIDAALVRSTTAWTPYNEFSIDSPRVAGLYVADDGDSEAITVDSNVLAASARFNLPVFVVRQGVVYQSQITSGEVQIGAKVTPQEIVQVETELSAEQTKSLQNDLLERSVFRFPSRERLLVAASQEGRSTYIREYAQLNPAAEQDLPDYNVPYGVSGKLFKSLTFNYSNGITLKKDYIIDENGELVIATTSYGNSPSQGNRPNLHSQPSTELGRDIPLPPLPETEWQVFCEALRNRSVDHIDLIASTIATVRSLLDEVASHEFNYRYIKTGATSSEDYSNLLNTWLEQITFHLYGLAAEAHLAGDTVVESRSTDLANAQLPAAEYEAVISHRLSASGQFRMHPQDIEEL